MLKLANENPLPDRDALTRYADEMKDINPALHPIGPVIIIVLCPCCSKQIMLTVERMP